METVEYEAVIFNPHLVDTGDNPHRGWKLDFEIILDIEECPVDTGDNPHRGWKHVITDYGSGCFVASTQGIILIGDGNFSNHAATRFNSTGRHRG